MRMILFSAVAALTVAGAASAQGQTADCRDTLDGGTRCEQPNGHVKERHPDGYGRVKTTSTDPADWGRSDGYGRTVTPPDDMVRESPILRSESLGRASDPWEPRIPSPWESPSVSPKVTREPPIPRDGGWKADSPAR